jgi:hypothetical protein
MKTITIAMPNSLITMTPALNESYSSLERNAYQNRTRLVAHDFEPFLKAKEEFTDCTFSADGQTCYMHLNLVRVNKAHTNALDWLKQEGIITGYSY